MAYPAAWIFFEAVGVSEFSALSPQSIHRPIRAGSASLLQPGRCRIIESDTGGSGRASEGMIAVPRATGPGLYFFLRYWNLPDETPQRNKHDGYFFTGDYAKVG
jgi:acyl-coenzyme A synthetase/AMP-(fatty) acid ligase